MREDLLGLELDQALAVLAREGITPAITATAAPKKAEREGALRVVYASDDAKQLTVSRFVDPIADART